MSSQPAHFHVPPRTPAQKAAEAAIHERYRGRKVPMDELRADAEQVTTMGEWYESHRAMVILKKLREAQNLTARDIAARTGLPEDSIRKLEDGNMAAPYLDALTLYAHAVGKQVFVQLADAS